MCRSGQAPQHTPKSTPAATHRQAIQAPCSSTAPSQCPGTYAGTPRARFWHPGKA